MRFIRTVHPIAWFGLALNCLLAFWMYSRLGSMDISLMSGQEKEHWEAIIQFMLEGIRPLHIMLLLTQAAALALMLLKVSIALFVACVASLFTMPGSLVYLLGCLLTHYRVKNAGFMVAPPDSGGSGDAEGAAVFPSFAVKKMLAFAGLAGALCLVCLAAGNATLALTFLALAVIGGYLAFRAGRRPALSLHASGLALSPGVLSERLALPYADMNQVTLFLQPKERLQFDIATPAGPKTFEWPLRTIEPGRRREALDVLADSLRSQGVALR